MCHMILQLHLTRKHYFSIMQNMNFREYWQKMTAKEKRDLAKRADTTEIVLRHIANGHRKAGASIIERLMDADPVITFKMMREVPTYEERLNSEN